MSIDGLLDFVFKGGLFMWPILFVFVAGIAITIERWSQLHRGRSVNRSASISVAMNTTAFGLMAAIPLLLFHAKLTSTTGQIVDSLEMASVKALNSISNFNRRYFEKKSGVSEEK